MQPVIRLLPQNIINRIAAGEVLERPASAIKELVENSLDAGAKNIEVKIEAGGKNLICVCDDGIGMSRDEMLLAVQRHATSKLSDDDLLNIKFFGFRGEALPAIGSVAKLKITSKKAGQEAYKIEVNGGELSEPEPAQMPSTGTKIEVRDLFFATPARLKFLKTEESEKNQCLDVIRKIAMANPSVAFTAEVDGKRKINLAAANPIQRITDIISDDFQANSVGIEAERENIKLKGFAGIPTYNRRTSEDQYIFVNNRPVKDKLLQGAIKAAYADFLGGGRFPVLALFIEVPYFEVDVNVHPAKAEVRFRDARLISGLLISALRHALESARHKASTTVADFAMHAIGRSQAADGRRTSGAAYQAAYYGTYNQAPKTDYLPLREQTAAQFSPQVYDDAALAETKPQPEIDYPLGHAKAQLHSTYIVAETKDSIIIVDQHAAHERLVYENYKQQIEQNRLQKQPLLVPDILTMDEKRLNIILSLKPRLAQFGFEVERFGTNQISISQVPALLVKHSASNLLKDIADDVIEYGADLSLMEAFEHVLETAACHNSIRAGRRLSLSEMDEMLRQMEATPHSGQCNHGRPTYVELKLTDVEKLFGRKG